MSLGESEGGEQDELGPQGPDLMFISVRKSKRSRDESCTAVVREWSKASIQRLMIHFCRIYL